MQKEFSEYNPKFARAVIERESGKRGFCAALFNAWLFFFPEDKSLSKLIRATLSSNIEKLRDRQKKAHDIFKVLEKNPPFKELSKNHEVWIVAPKNNCSGMSAAISYLNEIEVIKLEDKIYE